MSDLIDLLSQFNRKERFFLIRQALGNADFSLSSAFREEFSAKIGIEVPHGAFVAMDYHLDWIAASLRAYRQSGSICRPFSNSDQEVNGTQQDVDLLIAFNTEETSHIVLIEAKGYSAWDNSQMREKAHRLSALFGQDGKRHHPEVIPHFFLMSSKKPNGLNRDSWPAWMQNAQWLKLNLDYPRLKVTRCDPCGEPSRDGDHFCIKEAKEPSGSGG